jgi:hypothetical protein
VLNPTSPERGNTSLFPPNADEKRSPERPGFVHFPFRITAEYLFSLSEKNDPKDNLGVVFRFAE